MPLKKIIIDNSKEAAVHSYHWDPDVKDIISEIEDAANPRQLMMEIFLMFPDLPVDLKVSNAKYPHHTIKDGKCVLSIDGVRAAYARAKQTGAYDDPDIKEHIDGHRRELGMDVKDKKLESASASIDKMFNDLKRLVETANTPAPSGNRFEAMFEKPAVNAAQNGTPIQQPSDPAMGQQTTPQQTTPQPAQPQQPVADPNTVQQPTIPVQNVDPTEDTSMNNPIEGPDDRDQDNLDGNQRKEMYQALADALTQANPNNVFGTIFDQDVFKSEYKIVPYEMRYFYRLQNPVSVEVGDLKFIPFGTDLLDAQEKYNLGKKLFVFATNDDKPIFFNMLDKTIWFNDDKLNDSFDGFIDQLTQNKGELQLPEDNEQQEANVEYAQNPTDTTTLPTDTSGEDQSGVEPVDLSAGTPDMQLNTGLGDNTSAQTTPTADNQGEVVPVDLTQQNASVEYDDSVLAMTDENTSNSVKSTTRYDESIFPMLEDNSKKVNRAEIVSDIALRKFRADDIRRMCEREDVKAAFIGKTYENKRPKEEWNQAYLDKLCYAVVGEAFNLDYLLYLNKVAEHVANQKKSEKAGKIGLGVAAAAGATAAGVAIYKHHKKKKASKESNADKERKIKKTMKKLKLESVLESVPIDIILDQVDMLLEGAIERPNFGNETVSDAIETLAYAYLLEESAAFPNDELDHRNIEMEKLRAQKRLGTAMFESFSDDDSILG